ncbi:MAG: hypothetical protein ABEJ84_01345 [Halodesulfurarchaeum sp.]
MLPDLSLTCTRCGDELEPPDRKLSMETAEGFRHAYECSCGAITITVSTERAPLVHEA